ncbi:SLC13 family permease [Acidocella facilis]|uniref:SLC13 family permease n=1 Tax=Acidocella facilis TaxID=525 RepID=UPI001F32B082|nr:SLC13 family permease [Acidocella facilis]
MSLGLVLLIVAVSLGCIMARPFGVKEAWPALAGALLLVGLSALSPRGALAAVGQGGQVYLFLIGMMLLAELAVLEGVFDWAAAHLARWAGGSALALFTLVYALAVVITALLSNDATAVVFTPAVAAMAGAAGARDKLPYLLICAFVANAASFLLPISNPANLVLFDGHMPRLGEWLRLFGLASVLAILASYATLWLTQKAHLRERLQVPDESVPLRTGGRWTLAGLGVAALLLIAAAAFGWALGTLTFLLGAGCLVLVSLLTRTPPWQALRGVSWSVLPLVAGLFVMVAALDQAGLVRVLSGFAHAGIGPVGAGLGLLSNLANNLPVGLLAAHLFAQAPAGTKAAALIGVDLGPNLSVTGSLATILWLNALRREGLAMSAWRFLALGAVMMPPALALALLGLWASL